MYLRRKWQEDAAQLHGSFQFEKSILRTQKTLLRRRNFVIDWMEPPTFSCTSLGTQSPPYDTIKKLSHQHFFSGFKHIIMHAIDPCFIRPLRERLRKSYYRATIITELLLYKVPLWGHTRDSRILDSAAS